MQSNASEKVAIITTSGCPYCRQVKSDLAAADIPYIEIEITDNVELLNEIKRATGQSTVPQVFIGGALIGGATEVRAGLRDGTFQERLIKSTAEDSSRSSAVSHPLPESIQKLLPHNSTNKATATALNKSDEGVYASLMANMKKAGLGGTPGAVFSKRAALQWLEEHNDDASSPAIQDKLLRSMIDSNVLTQVVTSQSPTSGNSTPLDELCWVSDVPVVSTLSFTRSLNVHYAWSGPSRSALEVSSDLRRRILTLYDRHMTPDGSKVHYKAMARDGTFREYVDATAELQKVNDLKTMSREESMCFWINIYNALVVHATAVVGHAEGTLGRLKWYDGVSYMIGGMRFSLNDIEHGVLRGNAPSPASFFSLIGLRSLAPKTFGHRQGRTADPRRTLALTPVDPRIHFALNCGASSCPPIKVYTPGRLEAGLEAAVTAFCADSSNVYARNGHVKLSSIFKWYGVDFGHGKARDVLEFVVRYVPEGSETHKELIRLINKSSSDGGSTVRITYFPYDWTVNAVEE